MRRLFPTKRDGTQPDEVAAAGYDAEDLISGHVRFTNGFWLSVEGSWVDNRPSIDGVPSWDYSLDAVGEHAQVQFDPLSIMVEGRDGEVASALGVDDVAGVSFPDSTAALIDDVVDAIRNSRPPVVRADEALVVQAIVDSLYRSATLGHEVPVSVPPPRP